jgi:hypothetical protein
MNTGNIQPKADQPRVDTKELSRQEPSLQYRVQGGKNYASRMTTRNDMRSSNRS